MYLYIFTYNIPLSCLSGRLERASQNNVGYCHYLELEAITKNTIHIGHRLRIIELELT